MNKYEENAAHTCPFCGDDLGDGYADTMLIDHGGFNVLCSYCGMAAADACFSCINFNKKNQKGICRTCDNLAAMEASA